MKKIGIICEFNPFHNGHVYFLKKIKEKYKDYKIILVMSGNYTQRGELSLIDKWDKTDLALDYVNLVIELPFEFTVQSADTFAYGSISLLKEFNVDKIIFGSEDLEKDDYYNILECFKNKSFDKLVRSYLDKGNSYPYSMSKAINELSGININKGNDLLGISYLKYLGDTSFDIIKRTNNYNDYNVVNTISSGNSIRRLIYENKDISKYVPKESLDKLNNIHKLDDYFKFIKLKIMSEIDHLNRYMGMDEGLENRFKKFIYEANNIDDLINKIKSKRYTYNRIRRVLIYILCGYTKKDNDYKKLEHIRVLGFDDDGRIILKEKTNLPIITNYTKKYHFLSIQQKIDNIYYMNNDDYKHKPIVKDHIK